MPQTKLYPTWQEAVVFSAEGPRPQVLLETDTSKVVLVGLEADQQIPVHPAPASVYHFLAGTGWMIVDGERLALQPGAIVAVPAGTARGVEAETQLVFLGAQVS